MFLVSGGRVAFDIDLGFLRDLVRLLDRQLERLEEEAAVLPDPDGSGVFESADYLVGLGLVACQGYLAATYGSLRIEKPEALKKGPMHRSGYTIAELVNHGANFWKHRDEWAIDPKKAAQERTLAALAALGCEGDDYPFTNLLAALVLPTHGRLQALLSHLEAWRDALAGAA
jgi:hypothetical protein